MEQKMVFKIDEDVLKNATKCKKDFSCLSGEKELCRVELCVDNKIHFIKCVDNIPCSYRIPFGYSYVCICPVRKELHNQYRI